METNSSLWNEVEQYLGEVYPDIVVLHACESGSRAWGFSSEDSDYDVRFIYARPLGAYLSLSQQSDHIVDNDFDTNVDLVGWDVSKFLKLFTKGNASAIEWLFSCPTYYETWWTKSARRELRPLLGPVINGYANHWQGLATSHYRRYIADGIKVSNKRYLYVIRAILSVRWLNNEEVFSLPPIDFSDLLDGSHLDPLGRGYISEVFLDKVSGRESDSKERSMLNTWLAATIDSLSDTLRSIADKFVEKPLPVDYLDGFFRTTLYKILFSEGRLS